MAANSVDRVSIRMYKMGTGDCFTLKFFKGRKVSFKMLIDCGCWSGSSTKLEPYIAEMKRDVENHVNVLVATHEHKDHVHGFDACQDLFTNDFEADEVWLAWTEDDSDKVVRKWKREYGEKKRKLALAAERLEKSVKSREFRSEFASLRNGQGALGLRQHFSEVLSEFSDLHVKTAGRKYVGDLAGMALVKKEIGEGRTTYFSPGEVIENVDGLPGVRMFVLGPPLLHDAVKQEHGDDGESYDHNKDLENSDLFLKAVAAGDGELPAMPFDSSFESGDRKQKSTYRKPADAWRRIDHDWLFSSGAFALRMNSLTNNLSLALAIEFIDSGKVLLFPGDAEFGSWKSWQKVKWGAKYPKLTAENLLNRVVFYKVAHHLSHNGTARSVGLDQMTSPDLVAMATLDYDVISSGWKTTMPNRMLLKDLLEKTKGRVMVMNSSNLFFDLKSEVPLDDKVRQYRRRMSTAERDLFKNAVVEDDLFIEYTLSP
jgi:hypothetical protein